MLETQVTNSETSGMRVTQNDVMVRTHLAFDLRRAYASKQMFVLRCLQMFEGRVAMTVSRAPKQRIMNKCQTEMS